MNWPHQSDMCILMMRSSRLYDEFNYVQMNDRSPAPTHFDLKLIEMDGSDVFSDRTITCNTNRNAKLMEKPSVM